MRHPLASCAVLMLCFHAGAIRAQTFAAMVSPPRFEIKSGAGTTVRSVFELTNRSNAPAVYVLRTADWSLSADFNVTFHDSLQADSCRPWVALERPSVVVPANATVRYRFEVAVPAGAAAGECRFGILIEGQDPGIARAGQIAMPMTGRIGLIVYVAIGEARAELEVFGPTGVEVNGHRVPTLRLHNSGAVHGRVTGFLSGTDAKGVKYDFTPSDFPILPHQVADVYLTPSTASDDHPGLTFPVHVTGVLESGEQKFAIDENFD